MTHAPDQLGRQFIDAPDEADAHILLVHLPFFLVEILGKEAHEEIDLIMRPLPVFRGKRIDRQNFQLQIDRCIQNIMQRIHTRAMTDRAQEALPLRPASVAVHDDGNMARQARALDIDRSHFILLCCGLAKNLLPHIRSPYRSWVLIMSTFLLQRSHEIIIAWNHYSMEKEAYP